LAIRIRDFSHALRAKKKHVSSRKACRRVMNRVLPACRAGNGKEKPETPNLHFDS
jgi:hypothetical protein